MTRGAGGHPAPRRRSGEDRGADQVDEGLRRARAWQPRRTWRGATAAAAAENLGTRVEDENEDDEDQRDDADDHACTEAAIRRSGIDVDLAHWNLLYN